MSQKRGEMAGPALSKGPNKIHVYKHASKARLGTLMISFV